MRKGTFSVQTANPNSAKHNSRELAPKYLIDSSAKNYYELIKKDDDFIQEAQNIYKEKIKQTMQKKQVENLIQETVLTLQPHQNENDVKELFTKLNKKYGGHELLEIAIHRDEGHFLKDGIAYHPTKNILQKGKDWFICSDVNIEKPKTKDFDKKVDIRDFEIIYNYHAHAKFSMFDRTTGKTARMQKKDMSERIKFVSNYLGLLFDPNNETSRIKKSVHQVKDEHLARARELERQKENLKDLQYTYKEAQKQITALENANTEQKKELHRLNAIVNKTKTPEEIEALYQKIEAYRKENEHLQSVVELKDIEILDLQKNKDISQSNGNSPKTNDNSFATQSISKDEISALNGLKDDFIEEIKIDEKGIFNKKVEVKLKEEFEKAPKIEQLSLFNLMKKRIITAYKTIKAQAIRILNLEEDNKDLKKENKNLKEKLRTAEQEIKELSKEKFEHNPLNSEKREDKTQEELITLDNAMDWIKKQVEEPKKEEKPKAYANFGANTTTEKKPFKPKEKKQETITVTKRVFRNGRFVTITETKSQGIEK